MERLEYRGFRKTIDCECAVPAQQTDREPGKESPIRISNIMSPVAFGDYLGCG